MPSHWKTKCENHWPRWLLPRWLLPLHTHTHTRTHREVSPTEMIWALPAQHKLLSKGVISVVRTSTWLYDMLCGSDNLFQFSGLLLPHPKMDRSLHYKVIFIKWDDRWVIALNTSGALTPAPETEYEKHDLIFFSMTQMVVATVFNDRFHAFDEMCVMFCLNWSKQFNVIEQTGNFVLSLWVFLPVKALSPPNWRIGAAPGRAHRREHEERVDVSDED